MRRGAGQELGVHMYAWPGQTVAWVELGVGRVVGGASKELRTQKRSVLPTWVVS